MKELEHYDIAAQKFYATQQINSLPLISSDVSGEFFKRVCDGSKDIAILNHIAKAHHWASLPNMNEALICNRQVIVLTDAQLRIVHASHNIEEMNGYSAAEVIGKSPKMFQGEATCKETTKNISRAVRNNHSFEAVVLNYRKDGTPYNCWIKADPIFDESGTVVHFIAYEKEVA
jgi:PAS domain S-box-containing protein